MISAATLRGYAATTYGVTRPDGTQIGGYLAPEAMRQRLDSLASAK